MLRWYKAIWFYELNHVISFNQSESFISAKHSYAILKLFITNHFAKSNIDIISGVSCFVKMTYLEHDLPHHYFEQWIAKGLGQVAECLGQVVIIVNV